MDGEVNEPFVCEPTNNKGGCRIITNAGRFYNVSKKKEKAYYLKCANTKCNAARTLLLNIDEPEDLSAATLSKGKEHANECIPNKRRKDIEDVRKGIMKQADKGISLSSAMKNVTDEKLKQGHSLAEVSTLMKPRNQLASQYSSRSSKVFPPAIKDMNSSNIVIPDAFKRTRFDVTLGNKRFLLNQMELTGNAVWVFATDEGLEEAFKADEWAVDGCFAIPNPFKQLVTVHAKVREGKYIPAVYAFLPDKKKPSYDALVNAMLHNDVMTAYKEGGGTLKVTKVSSDFELNIINSFKDGLDHFPRSVNGETTRVQSDCCYFHFRKALIDKMKELGLANACYNMPETRVHTFMKALAALAFIPDMKVIETYKKIKTDEGHFKPKVTEDDKPKITALCRYFESQYLGVTVLHPHGQIEVVMRWNCYERESRTNNHVEAWHSSKKDEFSKIKNIFKFIVACQESASQDIIKLNHIMNNVFEPQKTKNQKKRDSTLKHVMGEYAAKSIDELDVIKAIITVV